MLFGQARPLFITMCPLWCPLFRHHAPAIFKVCARSGFLGGGFLGWFWGVPVMCARYPKSPPLSSETIAGTRLGHCPGQRNDSGHVSRALSRAMAALRHQRPPLSPASCPVPAAPCTPPCSRCPHAPCPLSLSPIAVPCPLPLRFAPKVLPLKHAKCAPYLAFSKYAARELYAGWARYAVCVRMRLHAFAHPCACAWVRCAGDQTVAQKAETAPH